MIGVANAGHCAVFAPRSVVSYLAKTGPEVAAVVAMATATAAAAVAVAVVVAAATAVAAAVAVAVESAVAGAVDVDRMVFAVAGPKAISLVAEDRSI